MQLCASWFTQFVPPALVGVTAELSSFGGLLQELPDMHPAVVRVRDEAAEAGCSSSTRSGHAEHGQGTSAPLQVCSPHLV